MTSAGEIARYDVHDGVAVLAIDSPPVNALSHAVRVALHEGIVRAAADADAKALVIRCDGRTFFAGADISEFGGEIRPPKLHDLIDMIEAAAKPIIAAIHGTALGGGFELALACHHRVAAAGAMVGLPEVALGLLPAAGGTQRIPRVVGVAGALELIIGGKPLAAAEAREAGLIDAVVPDDELTSGAVAFAKAAAARGAPLARIRDMAPDLDAAAASQAVARYRAVNPAKFIGFKAPHNIAAAIEAACALPFEQGLAREWELFLELLHSPESAAQRHLFFAERAAANVPTVGRAVKPRPVATVVVVGNGPSAANLATAMRAAGLKVAIVGGDAAGLPDGVERNIDLAGAVGGADLVVEAADGPGDERLHLLGQIAAAAAPSALIASTSFAGQLDAVAQRIARPEQVFGLRFVGARLLEVAYGAASSSEAIATAMALGRRLGRVSILARSAPGLVTSRLMDAMLAAADQCVSLGASPRQVDQVIRGHGVPSGPFEAAGRTPLDAVGRTQTAGRSDGQAGTTAPSGDDAALLDELLGSVAAEGSRLLDEGIALRASDIDVALVAGWEWPAWTGGPMFQAEQRARSGTNGTTPVSGAEVPTAVSTR